MSSKSVLTECLRRLDTSSAGSRKVNTRYNRRRIRFRQSVTAAGCSDVAPCIHCM